MRLLFSLYNIAVYPARSPGWHILPVLPSCSSAFVGRKYDEEPSAQSHIPGVSPACSGLHGSTPGSFGTFPRFLVTFFQDNLSKFSSPAPHIYLPLKIWVIASLRWLVNSPSILLIFNSPTGTKFQKRSLYFIFNHHGLQISLIAINCYYTTMGFCFYLNWSFPLVPFF